MLNNNSLASLKEGESARVFRLLSTGTMRRRLQDLGVVEGTRVQCTQKSPSGDPTAYAIRGAIIALRKEDAKNIVIDEVTENTPAYEQLRSAVVC